MLAGVYHVESDEDEAVLEGEVLDDGCALGVLVEFDEDHGGVLEFEETCVRDGCFLEGEG